eukprot:15483289-Alexandrium_andersonii.AAC.1
MPVMHFGCLAEVPPPPVQEGAIEPPMDRNNLPAHEGGWERPTRATPRMAQDDLRRAQQAAPVPTSRWSAR